MSIPIEKAVGEDLNLGFGSVTVTNPAGGTLTGSKIGIHSFLGTNTNAANATAVVNAIDCSGAEIGAKINDAIINKLPATGGIVFATSFGSSSCTTNPFANVTKPVWLILGPGIITTTAQWIVPSCVRLSGESRATNSNTGTTIKADSSYGSATTGVIRIGASGTGFSPGAIIEHVTVDCNSVASSIGIYSQNASEQCIIRHVIVNNAKDAGINITGGNNQFNSIEDIEIGGAMTATTGVGIRIENVALPARVERVTVNTGSTVIRAAILLDGCQGGTYMDIHGEFCTSVLEYGSATAVIGGTCINISGSSNSVTQVILIGNLASNGTFIGINPFGSTNSIKDNKNSLTYASATYAKIPFYHLSSGGFPLVMTPATGIGIGAQTPLAALSVGSGSLTDANVPIQVNAADGAATWIGVNRHGGYGGLIGYDRTGSYNGLVIRQVHATEPMDFVVANTTLAAQFDSSGHFLPGATQARNLGSATLQWNPFVSVIATASLPAAGATENGKVIIEDAGAGDRNLIIYAGNQRFRIDGGASF